MSLAPLVSDWKVLRDAAILIVAVMAISGFVSIVLVRRGLRTPAGLRLINRLSLQAVSLVRRPITIMVLEEVIAVIKTGHYTRNISDAIVENHEELKALAAEKIRDDARLGLIGKMPGFERVISEASESVIRVIIGMLADPRMDEFVSDLLRNNLEQLQGAVNRREYEHPTAFRAAGEPAPVVESVAKN